MLLIAIPVVFQPELRRALEQLGNSSFIPGSKKSREDAEVVRIVDQLVPFLAEASRFFRNNAYQRVTHLRKTYPGPMPCP